MEADFKVIFFIAYLAGYQHHKHINRLIPAISVIIPNFNHAAFLSQRIESVINQTFRDIEIIILDDCSTDGSREIIEGYSTCDNRIRASYNTVNSGSPFHQWKKGIELASGDLVWIAESDDYADADLLQRLTSKLHMNRDAGVAYCQSNFVDSEGQIIGNHLANLRHLDTVLWENDFYMSGSEAISRFMIIINIIPNASAVVFKKTLCQSVDWDKLLSFRLAGDRYFWIQLLLQSDLCFVAEPLNYFRVHQNTLRSRLIDSIIYLKEIKFLITYINSVVNVSNRTKVLAIRQWTKHFRNAFKRSENKIPILYYEAFKMMPGLLSIFLSQKK